MSAVKVVVLVIGLYLALCLGIGAIALYKPFNDAYVRELNQLGR